MTLASKTSWPLERALFALAGTMGVLSGLLAVFVSHWFGLLTVFAGANQWLYAVTGSCPVSRILRRSCRFDAAACAVDDRAVRRATEVNV